MYDRLERTWGGRSGNPKNSKPVQYSEPVEAVLRLLTRVPLIDPTCYAFVERNGRQLPRHRPNSTRAE